MTARALGGDVPESNALDFDEFCKENAHIVEQKYQHLQSWTKKKKFPIHLSYRFLENLRIFRW